jgi:hypothetical protein
MVVLCERPFISYATRDRLYGLCWRTDVSSLRIAATTFIPGEYVNKIKVREPRIHRTREAKRTRERCRC